MYIGLCEEQNTEDESSETAVVLQLDISNHLDYPPLPMPQILASAMVNQASLAVASNPLPNIDETIKLYSSKVELSLIIKPERESTPRPQSSATRNLGSATSDNKKLDSLSRDNCGTLYSSVVSGSSGAGIMNGDTFLSGDMVPDTFIQQDDQDKADTCEGSHEKGAGEHASSVEYL